MSVLEQQDTPAIAVGRREEAMEPTEQCVFCGETGVVSDLGLWVTEDGRLPIHAACWVAAYENDRLHEAVMRRSA